jgi:uncharacterized membrane protein required for colicin V production
MTWLDDVILVFLGLGLFEGLRRGLLVEGLTVVAYAAAWVVATRENVALGTYLDHRFGITGRLTSAAGSAAPALSSVVVRPIAPVVTRVVDDIAYGLLFVAVLLLASWVVRLLAHVPLGLLAAPNRLGGALFGAARNALLVLVIWAVAVPYLTTPGAPLAHAVAHSRVLPVLTHLAGFVPLVGHLLPVGVHVP